MGRRQADRVLRSPDTARRPLRHQERRTARTLLAPGHGAPLRRLSLASTAAADTSSGSPPVSEHLVLLPTQSRRLGPRHDHSDEQPIPRVRHEIAKDPALVPHPLTCLARAQRCHIRLPRPRLRHDRRRRGRSLAVVNRSPDWQRTPRRRRSRVRRGLAVHLLLARPHAARHDGHSSCGHDNARHRLLVRCLLSLSSCPSSLTFSPVLPAGKTRTTRRSPPSATAGKSRGSASCVSLLAFQPHLSGRSSPRRRAKRSRSAPPTPRSSAAWATCCARSSRTPTARTVRQRRPRTSSRTWQPCARESTGLCRHAPWRGTS